MTNYTDMALDMSKKAARAVANRACAMQAARSAHTSASYRQNFVQIARMSNSNAIRYLRLARTYVSMAVEYRK